MGTAVNDEVFALPAVLDLTAAEPLHRALLDRVRTGDPLNVTGAAVERGVNGGYPRCCSPPRRRRVREGIRFFSAMRLQFLRTRWLTLALLRISASRNAPMARHIMTVDNSKKRDA